MPWEIKKKNLPFHCKTPTEIPNWELTFIILACSMNKNIENVLKIIFYQQLEEKKLDRLKNILLLPVINIQYLYQVFPSLFSSSFSGGRGHNTINALVTIISVLNSSQRTKCVCVGGGTKHRNRGNKQNSNYWLCCYICYYITMFAIVSAYFLICHYVCHFGIEIWLSCYPKHNNIHVYSRW